jgi:hypothetical protein
MSTAPDVLAEQQAAESAALEAQRLADESAAASAAAKVETQLDQAAGGEEEKRKGGVQRRINELVRKAAEAEARADYFEKLAVGKADEAKAKPAEDAAKPKPKPADFETTEEYLDARDAWVRDDAVRVTREEVQKAEQRMAERTRVEEISADWAEREEACLEKHPDYNEVADPTVTKELLQSAQGPSRAAISFALQQSEIGPELLYHFCQNPAELQKLTEMDNPTRAVIALGRIEARLADETGGGQKPLPQTRGPKPITPVRKVAAHDDGELRDDLAPTVWRDRYLKKMEKKVSG